MPRGPAPKPPEQRRRRNTPAGGEWDAIEAVGWQHGALPEPPDGLREATLEAWRIWMGSWVAAHWAAEDLPGLRQMIRLYDQVERGEFQRANELRIQMDTFGLTPKGRQDRRWAPPAEEKGAASVRQIKARKLKAV